MKQKKTSKQKNVDPVTITKGCGGAPGVQSELKEKGAGTLGRKNTRPFKDGTQMFPQYSVKPVAL